MNSYYKIQMWSLIIVCVLTAGSFFTDEYICRQLFQRFGAIMVGIGIMCEFNLLLRYQDCIVQVLRTPGGEHGPNYRNLNPPAHHKPLVYFAHLTVVAGTLIWGLADLFFEQCGKIY